MSSVFRTPEREAEYRAYRAAGNLDKGCVLCARESLREFGYWRVIQNKFPYDRVAKIHHMAIPKRHVTEAGLSSEEIEDLKSIKQEHFQQDYDFIVEAMSRTKSIPGHFHIHLIIAKDQAGI